MQLIKKGLSAHTPLALLSIAHIYAFTRYPLIFSFSTKGEEYVYNLNKLVTLPRHPAVSGVYTRMSVYMHNTLSASTNQSRAVTAAVTR